MTAATRLLATVLLLVPLGCRQSAGTDADAGNADTSATVVPDTEADTTDGDVGGADTLTADSGGTDSSITDSGTGDSGATDSSITDSGAGDSGIGDSGAGDSGIGDSDIADSEETDARPSDVTSPDSDSDTSITPSGDVWCTTQWPLSLVGEAHMATETLYVQVAVDGAPPVPGTMEVEVAVGTGEPEDWSWSPTSRNAECGFCVDTAEYMGTAVPPARGSHRWAARAREVGGTWSYCDRADGELQGSADGWSPGTAPAVFARTHDGIVVETLNLRCLLDDWEVRKALIVEALLSTSADVTVFQEVCAEPGGQDNLTLLLAAMSDSTGVAYNHARAVSHWSWDLYDEGIALVSPLPLESVDELELPAGTFPRRSLVATVEASGGAVRVAVTHLEHRDQAQRDAQIAALTTSLGASTVPTVLMGDFNQTPTDAFFAHMADAGFVDAWSHLEGDAPGLTFPASRPSIRIDYVWWRPSGSSWQPTEIARTLTTPEGSVYGSDHHGLVCRIAD